MTNDKAQIIIGNIPIKPEVLDDCYDITEYQEAKAMAIKALEQQPITWIVGKDNCQVAVRNMPIDKMQKICAIIGEEEQQPCEDAISREEALKVMCDKCPMYNCVTGCSSYRHIEKMPSVTPQPKTGHWIKVTNGRGGHECDLCHEYAPSYQSGDEYLTKYCPNCGVKMEVEE